MSLPILYEIDGAVATITLNAPRTRNALTPEMLCRLADALQAYAADDALRALVLTGAGDLAFCAGGDLGRTLPLLTGDRAPQDEWDRRLLSDPGVLAASGLRDWPLAKPVIAAVNGACMAAGFELLLGTDIRLAVETASFALPEVRRGVLPFAGSMARLPRQIPQCHAMEILLTGAPFDAAHALRIGLVNRLVKADELLPSARTLAVAIAANAPVAVRTVKQTVIATSGLPLPESFALEDQAKAIVLATQDAREGPRAFMEKRAPLFRGR